MDMKENERWGELGRTETRRILLAKYDKCQVCRRIFDKNKGWYPHIHHKKYEFKFNVENFEVLCKICHGRRHPNSKFYNLNDLNPPCTQGNIHCKDCQDYSNGACSWSLPIEKPIRECTSIDDIEILLKYTQSEFSTDRRLAAKALGNLCSCKPKINDALPSLINLLNDDFPRVRRYAIKAIGAIGDKRSLDMLVKISNDINEVDYNRDAAKLAIGNIIEQYRVHTLKNDIC